MRRALHRTLLFVFGPATFAHACTRDRFDAADTRAIGGDLALTPEVVRVSDIITEPARYFGDTVTIVAVIDNVMSSFAFTLDESAFLAGGLNSLLVFSDARRYEMSELDDRWLNDSVRVTGPEPVSTLMVWRRLVES